MNGYVKDMLAEGKTNDKSAVVQCGQDTVCERQRTENPQSDSRLSPVSCSTDTTTAVPAACCISTTSYSPGAPSAALLHSPGPVGDGGTKQCMHVPESVSEMVCASEEPTQSHFSPRLHTQQESSASSPASNLPNPVDQPRVQSPLMSIASTDSSPACSTVTDTPQQGFIPNPEQFLNSIGDCGTLLGTCPQYNSVSSEVSPPSAPSAYTAEMDPMLDVLNILTADSIPSVATSIPFQNPNFTPQPPLNPEILSRFNISTCPSSNTHSSPFIDSSISAAHNIIMPPTDTRALNFDISDMLSGGGDTLVHRLGSEVSMMDESSLSTSLPHPTTSIDPLFSSCSHSYPQTTLVSDSNSTSALQDPTSDSAMSIDPMLSHSTFPQSNHTPSHDSSSTASLQEPMFCNSAHLQCHDDLVSQTLVDSQNLISNFHGSSVSCSSNPEIQDILQQFM